MAKPKSKKFKLLRVLYWTLPLPMPEIDVWISRLGNEDEGLSVVEKPRKLAKELRKIARWLEKQA